MTDEYDLKIVAVEASQTDKELQDMACKLRTNFSGDQGFYLTISGYDDDPREVWEIPEAIELCQRIIKTGLIALLELSSQIKELGARDFGGMPAPLGGFEVWIFSEGRMKHGGVAFSKADLKDFYNVLERAIVALEKLKIERN